jgi:hypothetical protein
VETTRRADGAAHYGDVAGGVTVDLLFEPPDGFTSVKDVTAFKKSVVNWGGPTQPQPHPTWVDLHGPGTGIPPQYIVQVTDLTMILRAWVDAWPYENTIGGLRPLDCP